MRFAICNEIFQDFPLEEQFAIAKRLGYDAVEVAPFTIEQYVTDITDEQRKTVVDLGTEHGLEIAGIHWVLVGPEGLHLTDPDDATRERSRQYMRDLTRFGCDIGGTRMIVGSPQQRNVMEGVAPEQARAWFAEAMAEAAKADPAGEFTICIEPLSPEITNLVTCAEEARSIAAEINLPNVGIILDVNAMSAGEKNIPDTIHASKEYVRHFHANDPNQRGPGWGDVDYHPIFEALLGIEYDGYVSVEVFDFSVDPIEHAEKSIGYLRKTLAEVEG